MMKIEEVSITKVKPYKNNPRIIGEDAIEKVANSIQEFGFQQPIVVDKDHVIIVGHTRLLAAKKLGMKTVPITVANNLTDEQVKAYRLADNKTGELAGWDDSLLLSEIDDLVSFDLDDFGFDIDDEIEEASHVNILESDEPKTNTNDNVVVPPEPANAPLEPVNVNVSYGGQTEMDRYLEENKDLVEGLSQRAQETFATKRVIITYRDDEEDDVRNLLNVHEEQLKVIYRIEELVNG